MTGKVVLSAQIDKAVRRKVRLAAKAEGVTVCILSERIFDVAIQEQWDSPPHRDRVNTRYCQTPYPPDYSRKLDNTTAVSWPMSRSMRRQIMICVAVCECRVAEWVTAVLEAGADEILRQHENRADVPR